MAQRTGIGIVLVVGLLLAGLAAGCGGGDSSGSEGSKNASGGSEEATRRAEPEPESIFKYGDRPGREVYGVGEEADEEERETASAILDEEYDARAAGDWAKQCALMTFEQSEEVRQTSAVNANCAKGVRIQSTPLAQSRAFRANPISAIEAFRVEGEWGFLLYRGKDGRDYAMLMRKEDGRWKVDDLAPTLLPES